MPGLNSESTSSSATYHIALSVFVQLTVFFEVSSKCFLLKLTLPDL